MKHTLGPWRNESGLILSAKMNGVGKPYGVAAMPGCVFTAAAGMIGSIEDNHDGHDGGYVVSDAQMAECEANANLFAAAPELLAALRVIAEVGGNLTDDRLTDKTGANDAVQRGLMYCHAREVARAAIRKVEPPC